MRRPRPLGNVALQHWHDAMEALEEAIKYMTEGHRLMDHGEPDRAYVQYLKAENANRRAAEALKEARKG